MQFKLKGWTACVAVLVIGVAAVYFKFSPGAAPTEQEIKAKLGDQLITQIKADILGNHQQPVPQLDKIAITSIQARAYAKETRRLRRNLLQHPDRYLIKVEYTAGESPKKRSLTLELSAPLLGSWTASPTPLTF